MNFEGNTFCLDQKHKFVVQQVPKNFDGILFEASSLSQLNTSIEKIAALVEELYASQNFMLECLCKKNVIFPDYELAKTKSRNDFIMQQLNQYFLKQKDIIQLHANFLSPAKEHREKTAKAFSSENKNGIDAKSENNLSDPEIAPEKYFKFHDSSGLFPFEERKFIQYSPPDKKSHLAKK